MPALNSYAYSAAPGANFLYSYAAISVDGSGKASGFGYFSIWKLLDPVPTNHFVWANPISLIVADNQDADAVLVGRYDGVTPCHVFFSYHAGLLSCRIISDVDGSLLAEAQPAPITKGAAQVLAPSAS